MAFWELTDVKTHALLPGFDVRFVHSERMTFAFWEIAPESELPAHSHPHEQVAHVLEGEFELTIDGEKAVLRPGTLAVIPSQAVHSGRAITRCRILDVFCPVREDYRNG